MFSAINLRKTKKHPGVQAWVAATGWQLLRTTVVTVAEIQCGSQRQTPSDPGYAQATQEWLDNLLEIGELQVFTHSGTSSRPTLGRKT